MIFHWDIIQGTDEWRELRAGKMTASVFKTFLVNGKQENGFGTGAMTQLYRVLEERLTGKCRENFSTKGTKWGHEYEPIAAENYEMEYFVKTKEVGFVEKNEWIGASPDRLIPSIEEGLEIKCFPTGHMQLVEEEMHGKDEYIQCQVNLWVTEYKAWNLYYYHPWLPESCNSLRFRFTPDLKLFETFEEKQKLFKSMVEKRIEKWV